MTKELARYFVTVIDRDLHFSFNEMGIPSGICEWLENQLMQENFDKVEEFIRKRYGEHENANKPKHKFRAVTKGEWCSPKRCPKCEYHYGIFYCDYSEFNGIHKRDDSKPYKKETANTYWLR